MGTNYYMQVPVGQAIKNGWLIPDRQTDEYLELSESRRLRIYKTSLKEPEIAIHICKKSCGWKLLFERQEGIFGSVAELLDLLKTHDEITIVNEYGDTISLKEFMKLLEEDGHLEKALRYSASEHKRWRRDYYEDGEGYDFAYISFS